MLMNILKVYYIYEVTCSMSNDT